MSLDLTTLVDYLAFLHAGSDSTGGDHEPYVDDAAVLEQLATLITSKYDSRFGLRQELVGAGASNTALGRQRSVAPATGGTF